MLKLSKEEMNNKVSLVLTKRNVPQPPKSAVKAVFDTSGSFEDEWQDGTIALLADRVLAVASRLDDDGSLDLYHFNNQVYPLGACNFSEIADTDKHLKRLLADSKTPVWRGTEFAPIVDRIIADLHAGEQAQSSGAPKKRGFFSSLFGSAEPQEAAKVPSGYRNKKPTLVYVLTDGDAQDKRKALSAYGALAEQSVYVMFINVSQVSSAAREIAEMYDNVGYVYFPELKQLSDESLLDSLLTTEFVQWRSRFPA